MKNRCKRYWLWACLAVLLLLGGAVWGGASYLLSYALVPERGTDEVAQAWEAQYRDYPGMQEWHDSLLSVQALRDTFLLSDDGVRLHAYYVRAARSGGRTAVLVHGYTDNAVCMMMLARMYERELGMNVLLPDLRYAGKSGGDHIQMGWRDRLDVKRWVESLPILFGDSLHVVVHGISMGAATTMMLSGEELPAYVSVFVEDCGFTSVYAQFSKELRERFHLPAFPLMPVASWLCERRYGWNFHEASALEAVKRCQRPMFFIHGDADDYVPTAMVYELYAAHPGPKALWVVPGAAHAVSYRDHPVEYLQRVKDFLGIEFRNKDGAGRH